MAEQMRRQRFEQKVLSNVDNSREEIIKFTQDLIHFKTENPLPSNGVRVGKISKEEINCQSYLVKKLESLGFNIDLWEIPTGYRNLVAKLEGGGGGRSLILNGHIDTVPIGKMEDWEFDPWKAELKNGRILGRGSVDMKGGITAIVKAVESIFYSNLQVKGDVVIELVSDEEMSGIGTRECIKRGYTADAAIFTEPTNLKVMNAEPGLIHFRIEVFGRSAHSSTRYLSIYPGGKGEGVNAIEKAFKLISAIRELEQYWANIKTCPNLPPGLNYIHPGIIVGGPGGGKDGQLHEPPENAGTVPDYCSIEYELKFYPNEDINQLKIDFEDYIFKVCAADPWLRKHPPKITWKIRDIYFPPASTSIDDPFVQIATAINSSLGGSPMAEGFTAVTDMCWYNEKKVPCIIYGPGETGLAHSKNESLAVEDLIYATKFIALTILNWCIYD